MSLRTYLAFFALFLFTCSAFAMQNEEDEFWNERLFIKLKETSGIRLIQFDVNQRDKAKQSPIIGGLVDKYKIKSLTQPFDIGGKYPYFNYVYEIKFDESVAIHDLMRDIAAHPDVAFSERVPIERISFNPSDPSVAAGEMWHLGKVNAYQAWDIATGLPDITIAVVDDALKITHEDLIGNLWVNPGEIAGNGIDDDNNGYIDDIHGYDLADNDNNPNPPSWATSASFSHGTHTGGIAAAVTNNGLGVASVSFGAKLMAVKCTRDATTNTSIIQYGWQGVQYAINSGADVISLSWGGTGSSSIYQNIINAARAEGIIIVASAGNAGSPTPFYPAAYDNVIAVAASTSGDQKASYSNYGSWISIIAPGSQIKSCVANNNAAYGYKSGTSMSAPLVAAACGLILSHNPTLTPAQVESALYASADNIDALNSGYVGMMGAGRLNIHNALQQVQAVGCIPPLDINASPVTSNTVHLTWTGIGADSHTIKIREAGGSWQMHSTTGGYYDILGLSPCTEYEVQVRSICSGSPSDYSASYFFTTLSAQTQAYCAVSGITSNLEWIAGVAVGGINSVSTSDGGYIERACETATLSAGTTYNLNLTPGYIGTAYTEHWRAWIDYNKDGDFNDVGELIYDSGNGTTSPISTTFTTPPNMASGVTRLRVAMKWVGTGDTAAPSSCGTFNYGEVEDFGVYLPDGSSNPPLPTCNAPDNFNSTAATTNSITLAWNAVSGSDNYLINYRLAGSGAWLSETVYSTFATIGGLQANANYEFKIKTVCNAGVESNFSNSITANTSSEPCFTPSGLSASNITASGATLAWASASGATTYNLRYRKVGEPSWTPLYNVANYYGLNGLSALSNYEFAVQSVCDGGVLSDFSALQTFQTSAIPCNAPAGLSASGVTSNGVVLTWTPVSGATHTLRYRILGTLTWQNTSPISGSLNALVGLQSSTSYEVQIRANCTGGSSPYSGSINFTTSMTPCQIPGNVSASGISSSSIQVTWAGVAGAEAYMINYRELGVGTWQVASSFSSSKILYGLNGGTTYEVKVKSDCGLGNQSGFSIPVSVSTVAIPICETPTNPSVDNITSTSASLTWSNISNAASFSVLYRPLGGGAWMTLTSNSNGIGLMGLQAGTTYQYMLRTHCMNGEVSALSSIESFTTDALICEVPTNVSISGTGSNAATVEWNATGGINYTVRYRTFSGIWQSMLVTGNTANLAGLAENTTYEVEVRSNCSFGSSAYSNAVSFTTESMACGTPLGLNVISVSENSILIAWSYVSGADAYNVSYRANGGAWMTQTTFSSFASINGLAAGTFYEFKVKADCGNVQSEFSAVVSATTDFAACSAPVSLWVSDITDSQAKLNWNAVGGVMSYTVEYRKSGTFSWTTLAVLANYVTVNGLEASSNYQFRVRTQCVDGSQSGYSLLQVFATTAPVTCPTPQNPSISSVSANGALLSWVSAAGSNTVTIHYREIGAATWTSLNSISGSSYMLTGLTPGTDYEVKINAVCSFGASDYSNTVDFTTDQVGCVVPEGLNVTGLGETQAVLNWLEVPGATLYNVRYRVAGSLWWTTLAAIGTSRLLTGLTPGTVYEFQVRTKCGTSVASSYSSTMVFTTPSTVSCAAPTAVLVSNIDTESATVFWNNIPGSTNYLLRYKLSTSGSTAWNTLLVGGSTSYNLWGLAPGFPYDVQVKALCGSAGSSFSSTVSFTTLDDGCGAPVSLYATDILTNQATVGFNLVPGAIYYNIQYRPVGNMAWVTSGTFTGTKVLIGLMPETLYEFRVRAYCTGSFSSFSDLHTFFTAATTSVAGLNEVSDEEWVPGIVEGPDCELKVMFDYEVNGKTVSFINKSRGGDAYMWDFGDGFIAEDEHPTHVFAAKGIYHFTLIVFESETGCTAMFEGDLPVF